MTTQLERHMTAAADQHDQDMADIQKRWLTLAHIFIVGIIFNMSVRLHRMNPGTKKKDMHNLLYPLLFDDTYQLFDSESKDYKVRVFFEPLIRLFGGRRAAALKEIKLVLDEYFPLPEDSEFEWNPLWKTIPYKPKDKNDKRTTRVTLKFSLKRKKK